MSDSLRLQLLFFFKSQIVLQLLTRMLIQLQYICINLFDVDRSSERDARPKLSRGTPWFIGVRQKRDSVDVLKVPYYEGIDKDY